MLEKIASMSEEVEAKVNEVRTVGSNSGTKFAAF